MSLVKRNLAIKNTNTQPAFTCPKSTIETPKQGVCPVISHDYMIIWLFHFMGKRQSREVTILPSLVAIDIVVVEI